jgi:hypothetical protein
VYTFSLNVIALYETITWNTLQVFANPPVVVQLYEADLRNTLYVSPNVVPVLLIPIVAVISGAAQIISQSLYV